MATDGGSVAGAFVARRKAFRRLGCARRSAGWLSESPPPTTMRAAIERNAACSAVDADRCSFGVGCAACDLGEHGMVGRYGQRSNDAGDGGEGQGAHGEGEERLVHDVFACRVTVYGGDDHSVQCRRPPGTSIRRTSPPPMLAITAFSAGARQERWMEAGRPYGEMHLWSITEDTPHALCILCHLVPDLQRGRSCT